MRYCAETDPQADRLLYILTEFRAVVAEKGQSIHHDSSNPASKISSTPSSTFDPMANLTGLYDTVSHSTSAYDVPSISGPKLSNITRHNSLASMAVPGLTEASSSRSSVLGGGGPKLDIQQQQLSDTTPPQSHHSTSLSSQNVNEYYRPLSTPNATATLQPTDPIGDGSEIDFDSFWHWSLNGMSGTGAAIASGSGIPGVQPASNGFANAMGGGPSFPAFSLNPAGQNGGGMGGVTGNIPIYPSSNFV